MSDEQQGTPSPETSDPIKNMKSEFDRKFGNTDAKLSEMAATNAALLAKLNELTSQRAPSAPAAQEELSDVFYKDPARYAQIVADRASAQAEARSSQREAASRKTQGILGQLQAEFPELASADHELTRKAVEIYNALPDDEKASSMSYKLAVQSAAVELGVKPRSKRPASDQEDLGSSGYSSSGNRSQRKSTKLDPATEELARMFGIDTSKAEVKDRLIKSSGRNWTKYQEVKK